MSPVGEKGAQAGLCKGGTVALAFAFVAKGFRRFSVGVLFTDQLLLCPWQLSCSASDKGELKEQLKQSKNLFPLKMSCVLAFPGISPGGCNCSGIQSQGPALLLPPADGSKDVGDAPFASR